MKFPIFKSGFTLVELLISIAIIGILAVIVLSSLNQSRTRAYDARVKEQLARFRGAAEIYYSNEDPNGYTPAVANCTTLNTIFTDTDAMNGSPGVYLDFKNVNPPVTTVCQSIQNAYALKATLPSGGYFCIDSRGIARVYAGAIGGPVTQCP